MNADKEITENANKCGKENMKSDVENIEDDDRSSNGEIFDEGSEKDGNQVPSTNNNDDVNVDVDEIKDSKKTQNTKRKSRKDFAAKSNTNSPTSPSRSRSKTYSQSQSPHSRSRTYSDSSDEPKAMKRRKVSRSRSRSRRRSNRRTSSSSSRDTYGSFRAFSPAQTLGKYPCKKCDRRDFDTIRELSEHEIRAHGAVIPCPHCSRDRSSVQKLVDHLQRRHGTSRLVCHYCKESFSSRIETAKSSIIDDYRAHIYKECLKEKMYKHERLTGRSGAIAQRGRGRCPHGPPVKCKNFPSCPGDKCYYFHGFCRHDLNCTKKDCPFDHTNRPRTCLSCLRDLRTFSDRDRYDRRRYRL